MAETTSILHSLPRPRRRLDGIHEVMAFTVSRRTREIGIRAALGAGAGRVATTIFSQPLARIGTGVGRSGGSVALLLRAVTVHHRSGRSAW